MVPEDMVAVFLGPFSNAVLKPLRYPCVNVRAGLGRTDPNFTVRQHSVETKQRYVRYTKASVDRERDEIGNIVAIPFVLASLSIPLAGLIHLLDFIVCERKL